MGAREVQSEPLSVQNAGHMPDADDAGESTHAMIASLLGRARLISAIPDIID